MKHISLQDLSSSHGTQAPTLLSGILKRAPPSWDYLFYSWEYLFYYFWGFMRVTHESTCFTTFEGTHFCSLASFAFCSSFFLFSFCKVEFKDPIDCPRPLPTCFQGYPLLEGHTSSDLFKTYVKIWHFSLVCLFWFVHVAVDTCDVLTVRVKLLINEEGKTHVSFACRFWCQCTHTHHSAHNESMSRSSTLDTFQKKKNDCSCPNVPGAALQRERNTVDRGKRVGETRKKNPS